MPKTTLRMDIVVGPEIAIISPRDYFVVVEAGCKKTKCNREFPLNPPTLETPYTKRPRLQVIILTSTLGVVSGFLSGV